MNRGDYLFKQQIVHQEGENKQSKIVLWDFDSVLHWSLYSGYHEETGEKNPEYEEKDFDLVVAKLNETTYKVINEIEDKYKIQNLYIFVRGSGNFRKKLYPTYKSKRKDPHPLINKLYEYVKVAFNSISADNCEAEDLCKTFHNKLNGSSLIVYVDHDLKELPGLLLNYKTLEWEEIDKPNALHNKYKKLVIGEGQEGANFTMGVGQKYWDEHFSVGMSIEDYEEAAYNAFLWSWSDKAKVGKKTIRTPNPEKATIKLIMKSLT